MFPILSHSACNWFCKGSTYNAASSSHYSTKESSHECLSTNSRENSNTVNIYILLVIKLNSSNGFKFLHIVRHQRCLQWSDSRSQKLLNECKHGHFVLDAWNGTMRNPWYRVACCTSAEEASTWNYRHLLQLPFDQLNWSKAKLSSCNNLPPLIRHMYCPSER